MKWMLGFCWLLACSSPMGAPTPGDDAGGLSDAAGIVDAGTEPVDGAAADKGGAPLTPGTSTIDLTVAGKMRTAILYVPAAAGAGPLPLVIALHGNGDTNTNFVAATRLTARADAAPFVLVAPQGIPQQLLGTTLSWDAYHSVAEGNIDEPLFDALRARLVESSSIDEKRVFVFGYSQGGYMSFRYGMDTAAALSCAGVLAAAAPTSDPQLVTGAARKIAVALQIGTLDFAIDAARATRATLISHGNPLNYNEIAGAGHVPIPGDLQIPLDFCLAQRLP